MITKNHTYLSKPAAIFYSVSNIYTKNIKKIKITISYCRVPGRKNKLNIYKTKLSNLSKKTPLKQSHSAEAEHQTFYLSR